jgi:iron complex transport system permease protein
LEKSYEKSYKKSYKSSREYGYGYKKGVFVLTAALVALAAVIALGCGKYSLSVEDIRAIITGGETAGIKRDVFYTLRLPRVVMVLIAGAGLGMAGSVYQIIFKNPLAAPEIIGVASGANLGAAAAIMLLGYNAVWIAASSFVMALIVVTLVIALVRLTGNTSTSAYILAGVVLKALSESVIMIFKFFADPEQELAAIEFWSMGSFGFVTRTKLLVVLPVFLIGYAGLVLLRRQVTLLGLNEDESRALGLRLRPARFAVLTFSTLMVAAAISVTGLIMFIGLIAPHIARLVTRRTGFPTCVYASLVGALILVIADVFARSIYTVEIPISILTTFVGVPMLVYFMVKRKRGRL